MRVFVMGYPGELGGACTELWHTIKLWRQFGVEVGLIPTWLSDPKWRAKVEAIGCKTYPVKPTELDSIPGLAGSIVVGFCNSEFLAHAGQLRELGCQLVWVNCMTFLFEQEKRFYTQHGLFDAFVFQSEFQRRELEPLLAPFGYSPDAGHLIRGAFDLTEFQFAPRPHNRGEVFVVGRMARPDTDKWSSNTWPIYSAIQYANKRALMLGMDDRTHEKLGASPVFADCLKLFPIGSCLRHRSRWRDATATAAGDVLSHSDRSHDPVRRVKRKGFSNAHPVWNSHSREALRNGPGACQGTRQRARHRQSESILTRSHRISPRPMQRWVAGD